MSKTSSASTPKRKKPKAPKSCGGAKQLTVSSFPPSRVIPSEQIAPLQYRLGTAAHLLAISKRTLERWIKQGRASATGRGKLRRMEYVEILRLLEELRREGKVD